MARFRPPASPAANREALAATADALVNAAWPVILADYVGRNPAALPSLLALAEALGAAVVDRGSKFNFPSTHELDATLAEQDAVERADVVLALDAYDVVGTNSGIKDRSAVSTREERPRIVIHITLGDLLQHSWATDYQRLHPVGHPHCRRHCRGIAGAPAPLPGASCRQSRGAGAGCGTKTRRSRAT